jgi:hypothetical protein
LVEFKNKGDFELARSILVICLFNLIGKCRRCRILLGFAFVSFGVTYAVQLQEVGVGLTRISRHTAAVVGAMLVQAQGKLQVQSFALYLL